MNVWQLGTTAKAAGAGRSLFACRLGLLRPPLLSRLLLAVAVVSLFSQAAESEVNELRLAVLTELSGPYASVGSDCISGLNIALDSLAPRQAGAAARLRLVYEDTRSDPTVAISAFHKLASDEKVITFFTTFTKIALPLNPLSKQEGIVLMATSGHPALLENNQYAFRFFPSANAEAAALAAQSLRTGLRRAAVITLQEEWNEALSADFSSELSRFGSVVYNASVGATENDFASYLLALKKSHPDLIFVNLTFGQIGIAIRKIRELGLPQPIFSNYRLQYKENFTNAGPGALEGALFFEANGEAQINFRNQLAAKAPNAAPSISFVCYTAVAALIQALNDDPTVSNRSQCYQAMLRTTSVRLLDGELKIVNREGQYQLVPRTIHNGVVVPFEERQLQ